MVAYFEKNPAAMKLVGTTTDFRIHLLTGDKFSGKYIGRTLRDEFKIESKMQREKSSFDMNQYTAKESGQFFVIEREWFYKEFNIPVEKPEQVPDQNENVIRLDIKPVTEQNPNRDENGEFQGKVPF